MRWSEAQEGGAMLRWSKVQEGVARNGEMSCGEVRCSPSGRGGRGGQRGAADMLATAARCYCCFYCCCCCLLLLQLLLLLLLLQLQLLLLLTNRSPLIKPLALRYMHVAGPVGHLMESSGVG